MYPPRSLKDVKPDSKRVFNGLAAQQIRRELCDMARSLYGPQGLGRHHRTEVVGQSSGEDSTPMPKAAAQQTDSIDLIEMTTFHEALNGLPSDEKEVFELIFYLGMSQADVAKLLNVSERTVKRRFVSSKIRSLASGHCSCQSAARSRSRVPVDQNELTT